MRRSLKSRKNHEVPYFGGLRSFKVIDVGTPGKLVNSACYDTQARSKSVSICNRSRAKRTNSGNFR